MPDFRSFRIVTNGTNYRVEGLNKIDHCGNKRESWVYLSKSNVYEGSFNGDCFPLYGEIVEFHSKEEATNHIRKEFGERGIRQLESNWYPIS
jgi:ribosomal protein L35AE/L33A